MTDLAPGGAATRSCPNCGSQNALEVDTCGDCGAPLPAAHSGDAEREDLETIEVERAVGAAGFDSEFSVDGDMLTCPSCGHRFRITQARLHDVVGAVDTASGGVEADVVTCNCPRCHTPGHAVLGLPDDNT